MNGKRKYGFSGIFLVVLMLLLLYYLFAGMRSSDDISYAQLRQLFQQEQVQSFVIRDTRITADLKDGTTATCDLYSFDLSMTISTSSSSSRARAASSPTITTTPTTRQTGCSCCCRMCWRFWRSSC